MAFERKDGDSVRRENEGGNRMKSPFYKMVLRIWSMQITAMLISLIVFMAAGSFLSTFWTAFLTTVVGTYVHTMTIYANHWVTAERDRNLALYNHITRDMSRGIRSGLYASIPNVVLTVIAIVQCYTGALPSFVMPLYNLWMIPFIGFIKLFENVFPPAFLLFCAITPVAAWFGYRNGDRLLRIMDKIVYAGGPRKPRSRDKRIR